MIESIFIEINGSFNLSYIYCFVLGLQHGSSLKKILTGIVNAPIPILKSHCTIVSPWNEYNWKNLPPKVITKICKTTITKTMIQNNLLAQILLKMFSSSLILLQQIKLKTCKNTKTLKMKVKCLLYTRYFWNQTK
jgi:hypothetical protein